MTATRFKKVQKKERVTEIGLKRGAMSGAGKATRIKAHFFS